MTEYIAAIIFAVVTILNGYGFVRCWKADYPKKWEFLTIATGCAVVIVLMVSDCGNNAQILILLASMCMAQTLEALHGIKPR